MSTRFELGSPAWFDAVMAIVRELLAGTDLTGTYSFSEQYVNAPEYLPCDATGRIGWHFRVANGALTTAFGPLDGADMTVLADYTLVQPFASIPSTDLDGTKLARRAVREGVRNGRFSATGKVGPSDRFPALAPLHDRVAAITR